LALERAVEKDPRVIGTIVGAIVVGLVVGALARLVVPGRQNVSVLVTVILGILGSLVGSWVVYQLGYRNFDGGFEVIPFLAGVAVAVLLVVGYGRLMGSRQPR
jgi:uncharacterized membrane protein YeaQ/YmgE (transglycosylase-associated protein family)